MSYPKPIPVGKNSHPMQTFPPPVKAVQRFGETVTVSSVITFDDNASQLEIGVTGTTGVAIRWVPATETDGVSPFASVVASGASANFDHIVQPNEVRTFVIPKEVQGVQSVVGVNIREGLFRRVAWVQATAASGPSIRAAIY